MTETVVLEWLADYGALSPVEVHSFASSLEHNQELVTALYNVLEERNRYQDLIDPVCTQLFGFYRSREVELQRFTLQFLPTLIFVYLNSVAHGDKKSCRAVETLLIGLYNLEAVDENGQPKVVSFRLPSLAQDSIYHEPMSLAPASLTESALRRLEECNTKLVSWGPLPQVEVLNAQNRLKVMTALLFVYNHQLGLMPKSAMEPLCKVSSKLVTQGFNKPGHHQRSSYGSDSSFVPRLLPRIPVSSQFLLEFVNAIYFAMFNGYSYIATQALEDIYHRACYECYSEVILVANAIRNSLTVNPSGQPCDGPMGISVALSPATTTVTTVSKSMITNASFRTKKLPDDIPIQNPNDEAGGEGKNLASISEEQEELEKLTPRGSSLRAKDSMKKLPNFPGLGKKVKDTKGTNKNGVAPLEKKDSLNEGKKSLLANAKDGSKNPSNRGSILSVVLNGGDSSTSDVDGPLRKKSSSAMESANGPVSLEGTMTNGSISSVATTGDLEKGADSLATTSDALETQSLFTADSMDLSVSEDGDKLGETPLSHCKQMDLQNHSSMQISTV
ncbi:hyccin [Anabrus simplex]|uniref:hyccin n=1 Tax=Anabrus simplex TaxID=316456 RepID=UPI0035A2B9CF